MNRTILVTGGAGFIGSALVRLLIEKTDYKVVNLDRLSYAGSLESLKVVEHNSRYRFVLGDISNSALTERLLSQFEPVAIVNLAAETHVDRSIDDPETFIQSNVLGTFALLETARSYWNALPGLTQQQFRFLHVSTDEVFGSLEGNKLFNESTPYDPSSPYSASKAASDHLVRAWHRTYGLPVLVTNCSNNYGPYQFPEKLIPMMVLKAFAKESLPIYGRGDQIRDWIYVEDHVEALLKVLHAGSPGETYNLGGRNERTNLEVVHKLCQILTEIQPSLGPVDRLTARIDHVEDRPGHDQRYAIDNTKVTSELNWHPSESFDSGLEKTVRWICSNLDYYKRIDREIYQGERLGLNKAL